ncbi:HpcH/HpaI aldolase/citrate lyase family protein [Mesotoga sp.]|uniref:HpcH/HpaI aldolase/citrate lyase family protein n=1 Tax=Mesotoga sp. TaxID=2053577 RepID=UPI00345E2431
MGGVVKSASSNKMNEINPHRSWAKRVRNRAKEEWSNRKRRRLCKTLFVIDLIGEQGATEKVV